MTSPLYAIVFGVFTLLSLVFALLMTEEAWALFRGQDPLINIVRSGTRAYPQTIFGLAVVLGLLLGHFFWR